MEVSLTKQVSCWHNFVKKDLQLDKTLIKDVKLCRIILSNKKVFSKFNYVSGTAAPKFEAVVSNERVSTVESTVGEYWNYTHCYGKKEPGYFAFEVEQMTHLSQFLMFYSAWLTKKHHTTF